MRLALLALLLCGCWGKRLPGWDATDEAGFIRMAIERHRLCVENNSCIFVSACHRESEAYCVENGYPMTCGNGEREGSCGAGIKRSPLVEDAGT